MGIKCQKKTNYNLKWETLCRTKNKPNTNNTCKLCSLERLQIERNSQENILKQKKRSNHVYTIKISTLKEFKNFTKSN